MTSMKSPVFSVVMPSYNHEKFIDDAIKSVVSQSIEELELIIVDDFSTDNSKDTIRSWVKKDSRIKAIFHKRNEGIARTCDDGIRNARGKYIALMASDDMFKENAFEKILDVLESTDYGVAVVEGEIIDVENRRIGLLFSQLHRKPPKHQGDFFKDLIRGNFVCTGIVRRCIIENHRISHDENLERLDDWLFWLDLSSVCKFVFIEEPLYYHRIHRASASQGEPIARDALRVYDIVLHKYGSILDFQTKSILLKKRGIAYRKYDFEECKRSLYQSFLLNPSFLGRIKTLRTYVLVRLFGLTPSLTNFYLKVRRELKPRHKIAGKMLK
ncbi:MAG: glycosyltransferase family 2 protein [Candidatus Heimdallarchaeota archaeon]